MNKINEIEALRAYSVLGVLLFHYSHLKIGWMGVWVFFVISGFVITISLLREPANSTWQQGILNFYRRRFIRIGPLYVSLIAFSILFFGIFGAQPPELPVFEHVFYLMTGTYNFYRLSPDYVHTRFFGHYWSLCIEEQFYIIYPFLFFVLAKNKMTKTLAFLVILCPLFRGIIGNFLSSSSAFPDISSMAVYFSSFLHFDAFALGCLVALNKNKIETSPKLKTAFKPILLVILAAWVMYLLSSVLLTEGRLTVRLAEAIEVAPKSLLGQVVLYSLISFMAAALIVGILIRDRFILMFTEWKPLQWIGGISFGIYMFHFPILALYEMVLIWLRIDLAGPMIDLELFVLYFAMVLGASSLSFYWFERPIARHFAARRMPATLTSA